MASKLKQLYDTNYVHPMILREQRRIQLQRELEAECQVYVDTINSNFTYQFKKGSKIYTIRSKRGISQDMFECIKNKTQAKYGPLIEVEYHKAIYDTSDPYDYTYPYVRMIYKE